MKCLCGYAYEPEWNRDATYEGGHKEFVHLEGNMFVVKEKYERDKEVAIYACPECNTLKMERIW